MEESSNPAEERTEAAGANSPGRARCSRGLGSAEAAGLTRQL